MPLLAKFFADKNLEVRVYAFTLPHPIFHDKRVEFSVIPTSGFRAKFLNWLEKTEGEPANIWRPRFNGSRLAGLLIGAAEFIKYKLRKPISWLVLRLWGHLLPEVVRQESLTNGSYTHILRLRFGSQISDKSRQIFAQAVEKKLEGTLDLNTSILCHDRYTAELTLKLFDEVGHVIFDIVELLYHRSRKSLESGSKAQTREISFSEELLKKAVLMSVGRDISQAMEVKSPIQEIYNGRQRSNWALNDTTRFDPNLIAFSGALFPKCGLIKLLEVLSFLPPAYNLLLVGQFSDLSYRTEVFDLISKYRLSSRIEVKEHATVEEMPKLLSQAAIYVIPFSIGNPNLLVSMPNRLFDALSAGLPILAQKGLHLGNWVKSRNIGDIVDFTAAEEAAEKIATVLQPLHSDVWRQEIYNVFIETSYESQMEILDGYLANNL